MGSALKRDVNPRLARRIVRNGSGYPQESQATGKDLAE